MAANPIARGSIASLGPYTSVAAVTADGSAITPSRGIRVNVAGNVNMTFVDGTTATLALNAGQDYQYSVKSVAASGTTATGIFALY